jgi:tetratricopeptide (TPR) repeat protein
MEQIKMPEVQRYEMDTTTGTCVNCEARAAMPGYATNLCDECRKLFIKYPIPLWIKLFAGGVCLVVLFALFTFPDKLSLAIHLERGKKAANNNRFVTARKEFEKVVEKYPQHAEARGYLMLAAFYNNENKTFIKYSNELRGTEIENSKLLSRMNDVQEKFYSYFYDSSYFSFCKQYDNIGFSAPDSAIAQFVQQNPGNICALYEYASKLYQAERYKACDSVLVQLLEIDDTHLPGLQLIANSKRQMGDFNAAIKYCERVLELNKESAYTYAMMARTYLKQRRHNEALDMAYKAMSIDDKFPFVRATMALTYHFTHQFELRDKLVKEAKASKDSILNYYFEYVNDVINNKEQFR